MDTRFFHATPEQKVVLAGLEYALRHGKDPVLLVGATGTGKTLLIRSLLARSETQGHGVVLTCPSGGEFHLIREAAKSLGVILPSRCDSSRALPRLRRHLSRIPRSKQPFILIVDQVENLSARDMEQFATLLDVCHELRQCISVLVVGQSHFAEQLDQPENAHVRQMFFQRYVISALPFEETSTYIRSRLQVAGAGEKDLFDEDAARVIHAASGGVPRLINNFCDSALLAAYGAGVERVDGALATEAASQSAPQESAAIPESDRTVAAATTAAFHRRRDQKNSSESKTMETPTQQTETEAGTPASREALVSNASTSAPIPGTPALPTGGYLPVSPVHALLTSGEALLGRLEHAISRADQVTAAAQASYAQHAAVERHVDGLTQSARRLADRLEGAVEEGGQSIHRLEDRIRQALSEVEKQTSAVGGRATEVSRDVEKRLEYLEQACGRAGRLESRLTTLVEQLTERTGQIQAKVGELAGDVEAGDRVGHRLQTKLGEVTTLVGETDEAIRDQRAKLAELVTDTDRTIESQRAKLDDLIRDWVTRSESIEKHIQTEQAKRQERMEAYGRLFAEQAETAERRTRELDQKMRLIEERAEHLGVEVDRSERTARHLATGQEEAESLAEHLSDLVVAACKSREELTQATTESKTRADVFNNRVASAEQRLASHTEQLECTSARMGEIRDAVSRAETTVGQLADASSVLERGEKLIAQLPDICKRVETLHRQVATGVAQADEACQRVVQTREQTLEAETTLARLTTQQAQAKSLASELAELLKATEQTQDALNVTVAGAVERATQIGSHTAAATQVLTQLNKANIDARKARADSAELTDRLGSVTKASRSAVEAAQTVLSRLAEGTGSGSEVARNLQKLTEPAEKTQARLRQGIEEADQRAAEMKEGCQQAGKLVQRLSAVARVLATAREREAEIKTTLKDAEAAREQLQSITTESVTSIDQLSESNDQSRDLIEQQNKLQAASQATMHELRTQLEVAQRSSEVSEKILEDFVNQAEELSNKLSYLNRKAVGIEETVEHLCDKPESITAAAQEQAVQLQRVCQAVRKVFGGLSKTSLEAARQTQMFDQVSQQSRETLEQLGMDTRTLIRTLQGWVEEAVRVQTRMEGRFNGDRNILIPATAETTPNIPRTASRGSTQPQRRKHRDQGELISMQTPVPDGELSGQRNPQPRTRAEEISKLIEEAKVTAGASEA